MSLRARFLVYLIAVHALMAGLAGWLIAQNRLWLIAAEIVLVISLLTGVWLVRSFFASVRFVDDSAQLLEDSDFMSRVRAVGQPEIDRLVAVYNRMVDSLRDERVRVQEQQQFLALVLQGSPGGILVLDFDRRVTLANPAAERLLQRSGPALQGQVLDSLPDPVSQALAALAPGTRRVLALWGGRRVRAQHGTFLDRGFRRSFFLLEELTEELRQSEKTAYEKLIRLLSHEVNNTVGASNSLLHSSLSYAPQLRAADQPDFEQAIGVVIARTEQLSAFMRSFADVVRLPAPRREPSEPADLVEAILTLVRAQADARGIVLRRAGEARLGLVQMDRVQMEHVLLNLVKNGLEAIGRDGTLTVRLLRHEGRPAIEIEDTGPGIPDDVRANLFTPFFSTKEGGQGIGLTMVQEILANHRFPFSFDAPEGGPTRVTVVLGPE